MKFFTLLFVAVLSAAMLIGCERQLLLPPPDPAPPIAQFAQTALSDLADTAAKRAFVDLANAASEVAEILVIDDGTTSVQPLFSKLHRFAVEADFVHRTLTGCEIDFGELASLSAIAVEAYTKRINAADMQQALQHLVQGVETSKTALQQLPTGNTFIPFTFGYGSARKSPNYQYGVIVLDYDTTIRALDETKRDVITLLEHKGYTVTPYEFGGIELNAPVDPLLLLDELIAVPGVARGYPWYFPVPRVPAISIPPPPSFEILGRITTRYNKAWCQGTLDVNTVDSILIEESGLDFFNYAFLQNLADIYAEEKPESAERVRTNRLFHRSMASEFLDIYFQHPEKTLAEILELFRQSVKMGNVSLELVHYIYY